MGDALSGINPSTNFFLSDLLPPWFSGLHLVTLFGQLQSSGAALTLGRLMPKKLPWGILGVVLLMNVFTAAVAQQFTEIPISIPGLRYGSIAWGDFNNDGYMDLLIAGDTGSGLITRIYRNDWGTNFVDIQAGLPGISSGSVVWGDYNGDGYLDIAVTGMSSTGRVSRIYRNNQDGTFSDIQANIPGLESSRATWVDFDNDGHLDLLLIGYSGSDYFARIYHNDGNDAFSDSGISTIIGGASGSAAWADFDQDGNMDLLFAGFTLDTTFGQSARLYRNTVGEFTNITSISLTAMSLCSVAWGDYDNDGYPDILMAGSSIAGVRSYPTLELYHNDGTGTSFTPISSGMLGAQNCSLAWGDFDNDGLLDVAISGYDPTFVPSTIVYRNTGGGAFINSGISLPGLIDGALAWGDFDNDGNLDLIVTGFDGTTNVTKLYHNRAPFGNAIPSPPDSLNAFVSAKSVTFNWSPGSDANQLGGFSYNLRVGTVSGVDDVMPSMADANTGSRRVPVLGNVSEDLSWTLNLPVGTYYWSVQTIDHSFAGSAFAPEQTFQIPPQLAEVATTGVTDLQLGGATLRGTANPNGDPTTVYFEYGTDITYGNTTASQDIGGGANAVNFNIAVTNLLPGVTYEFRAVASNSFGLAYGTNLSFTGVVFTEVTSISLAGVTASSVSWGDYDNDGYLDLLISGATTSNQVTRIYRNLGGTNFVDIQAGLPGISGGQAVWGDFNNDGKLDVLLTGAGISMIFRNDGSNVFTDIGAGLAGFGPSAAGAWADFNNDGALDIAIAGAGGLPIKTYRNDGNSRFTDLTNSLPTLSDGAIAWADYNNDGSMDLLVSGFNYGPGGVGEITRLYLNDGRGNFADSGIVFQGVSQGSVAWGDYNNDGFLDFLVTGSTGSGSVRYSILYSNNAAGGFVPLSLRSVLHVDQSSVAWGDFDGDGYLDFAISGMSRTGAVTKVYRNQGGMLFQDSGSLLPRLSGGAVAWGDFDNDGKLDLMITGNTGSNYIAKLYRNNSLTANVAPTAPGNLSAAISNDAATLIWSAAFDPNQSGGLSYNLRVGTTPGAGDVVSPMASANGFRRIPRLGNANCALSWTITNLNVGTFYWSVQAIDNSFAGSPFASEASFQVPARSPRVTTGTATNISETYATLSGLLNPNGLSTFAYFDYGPTTNYGLRTGSQGLGSGTALLPVSTLVQNLAIGSTNHFRLVATNSLGASYGQDQVFVTLPQFTDIQNTIPDLANNYAELWGDFDGDGNLDVLQTGYDGYFDLVRVLRNDGTGAFEIATTVNPFMPINAAVWGDFDSDNRLDFAFPGASAYSPIYHNDGSTNFIDISAGIAGVGNGACTWVDYNNDGKLGLLVIGQIASSGSCRLYRNDGAGVFTVIQTPMPGLLSGAAAWADYDNDGRPDLLIVGNSGTGSISQLYHNDGDGNFSLAAVQLPGIQSGAVAWGDFDNDGYLDFALAGDTGSGYITKIYRNDGRGHFSDINAQLPGLTMASIAWGDYDNDGYLDLLVCGTTNGDPHGSITRLYRNTSVGGFVDSGIILPPFSSGTAAWGDYDGDGNLDILLAGPTGPSHLLHNNQPRTNQAPSAPAMLSSSVNGSGVTLKWAAASDANQNGGFTYNVRIGSAPGLDDVLSPQANLQSGKRYLPQMGNAYETLSLTITNLRVGPHYWAVQAIDASFAGSVFSAEANFIVPPRPPDALTLSATNIDFSSALLQGSVTPNGLETTVYFQYGFSTNFGLETPAQAVAPGGLPVPVQAPVSALSVGVAYFYRLVASNSLGIAFGTNQTFTTPQFTQVDQDVTGFPTLLFSQCSWADSRRTGVMDVFLLGLGVNSLYLNSASAAFTNAGFSFAAGTSAAWGDFNNDGELDLFVGGSTGSFVYRNDGSNSFTQIPLGDPATYWSVIGAWGDYDNDGRLDLIISGNQGTTLYHNLGGRFVTNEIPFADLAYGRFAWGDYDNDGNVDLLVAGQSGTILYRNDGKGGFVDSGAKLPTLYYGSYASVSWADYDRDGLLDILMTGAGIGALVFHNDGNGSFHEIGAGLPPPGGGSAAWGDFDNDGYPDILLTAINTGTGYVAQVYHNNRDGTFTGQNLPLAGYVVGQGVVGSWGDEGAWVDYNNDGNLDIMLTGGATAMAKLFRNNSQVPHLIPLPPSDLTATPTGNGVTLTWSPGADPNQNRGFTYNLRIGRTPGGVEVLGPASDPNTGFHQIPALGNAFEAFRKSLTNLTVGTYYWSVQTIDNSFAGSPFAPEGSFTIPPQLPNVQPRRVSGQTINGANFNAQINPNASSTVSWFEYGSTTNYGFRTAVQQQGDGTNWLAASGTAAGLLPSLVYHYRAAASNAFGIVFGADQTFRTLQFTSTDIDFVAAGGSVTAADFDNDGNIDFMVTSGFSPGTALYRNQGQGNFTNSGILFPAVQAGSVAWGDFDRDGFADLAFQGLDGSGNFICYIYRNDQTNQFTIINSSLSGGILKCGDFDNDGALDLLLNRGYLWEIARNAGNGQFPVVYQDYSLGAGDTELGDYDNSGNLDVFVSGTGTNGVEMKVFRNDGHLGFPNSGIVISNLFGSAAWGDYDNDGHLDLLVSGGTTPGYPPAYTKLYHNDGGWFTEVPTPFPNVIGSVAWADIDNDGRLDALISADHLFIFRNEGNGRFRDITADWPTIPSGAFALGDVDNDGRLDLIMSNPTGSNYVVRVYQNHCLVTNTPPNAPTGLSAVQTGSSVTFSWLPATDPNQTGGLTYNLRVGSAPGKVDVVSPMADPITGQRRLPGMGTVQQNLSWTLRNLLSGTYYWSVQAVDNSFAGSVFAPEMTFIQGVQPAGDPQLVVLPEDTSQGITLTGSDPTGITNLTFTILTQTTHGTLAGIPPNLTYQPATNYFGADGFSFVVNNGLTDSVPAQVTIVVTQVPAAPSLSLQISSNVLVLRLVAEPYDYYRIEASQDLIHWMDVTNLVPTNGPQLFTDPDAALYSHRFYRPIIEVTPPRILSQQRFPTGPYQFSFSSEVGRYYQVLGSTNLQDWVVLTNVAAISSNILFWDPSAGNYPRRFYQPRPHP
jgi:hypothetical protein